MKNKIPQKPVPLQIQAIRLRQIYPELIEKLTICHNKLHCVMLLQPSLESTWYTVRIEYSLESYPQVWLMKPKELATVNGRKPHHIYKQGRSPEGYEKLCVFYPHGREWNRQMYLAQSFVPWIITWLSAYEYWQITGEWLYPESKDLKVKETKFRVRDGSRQ